MARRIALQHHERWDGNGYLGYKGEEIDYLARFVTVADVFDALVSKRSYKAGLPRTHLTRSLSSAASSLRLMLWIFL